MAGNALEVVPPQTPSQLQRVTLEPNTLAEAKEFAEIAAKSQLVPKDYVGNAFNVLIAIQLGKELGVQPMQALQGIAVINGRPAVWGDLALAIVKAHPDCEDIEEEDLADIKAAQKATCVVRRRGKKPVKRTFSVEDAKTAGLWGKTGKEGQPTPWVTYPYRMLQMRARGFAIRDAFPDAMKGLISVEEARDYDEARALSNLTIKHIAGAMADVIHGGAAQDGPITQDEAREFGKAWKAAGHAIDEAKAFLKETIGVDSSLKIPSSKYAAAMTWARTPKQIEQKPAAAPEKSSHDKDLCFELFRILSYDDLRQAAAIKEHAGDWAKLALALEKELPVEN